MIFVAVALATRLWAPPAELARALTYFSRAQIDAGHAYVTPLRTAGIVHDTLVLVAALALVLTPLGAWLARTVTRRCRDRAIAATGAITFVLLTAATLLELPFALWVHGYRTTLHMTTQSVPSFLGDQAIAFALMLGIGVPAIVAIAWLAKRAPRRGWLWIGGLVCMLQLVGTMLFPVLIAPLFNRLQPIAETPWAAQEPAIRDLVVKGGVPRAAPVLVADASRQGIETNAYVAGLLGSERVVLFDTLLAKRSPAIVQNTLGHELGHWRLHHVRNGLVWSSIAAVLGIGFLWWLLGASRGRGPLAVDERYGARAVLLLVGLLVVSERAIDLGMMGVSRAMETAADDAGLALTGDVCTFVADEREWAIEAHADVVPHPVRALLGSHPETVDRIERACHTAAVHPACCRPLE